MKRAFLFLWPYLRRYRRRLVLGFAALTAKAAVAVSQPLAIRASIDALTNGRALSIVLSLAALLVAASAVKGFFQYWMRVILIGMSRDVEFDLRNDIFARLVTLDQSFFARMRTGDILARATNDMNAVRMMLGPGIMYWFETTFTLILAVAVMFATDWPLTLIALIPAPLVAFVVFFFERKIHDRFEAMQALFSDISTRV